MSDTTTPLAPADPATFPAGAYGLSDPLPRVLPEPDVLGFPIQDNSDDD